MKRSIVGVAALLVLIVVGLQLFLAYGMTDSLRRWGLPLIQDRYGLEIAMDRVSVNLLAGSLTVHGVRVANPPGFEELALAQVPKFNLEVGWLNLLRGGITDIEKAVVKDARLCVTRNREGRLNVQSVGERIEAASAATAPPTAESDTPAPRAPDTPAAAPLMIRELNLKTTVAYVDRRIADPPFTLALELLLRLHDVSNYGPADDLSGTADLQGRIVDGARSFAFDLRGRLAPLTDPAHLSFDIAGSTQPIDLALFRPFLEAYGIEAGQVSVDISLVSDRGVFDPKKSELRLAFREVKLDPRKADQRHGIKVPAAFTASAPVAGTLTDPRIDLPAALAHTLLSQDLFDSMLQGVMEQRSKPAAAGAATSAPPASAGGTTNRGSSDDWHRSLREMLNP